MTVRSCYARTHLVCGFSATERIDMAEKEPYTVDLSSWTRLPEVVAYADDRGISLHEAIRELVNTGLSHQ